MRPQTLLILSLAGNLALGAAAYHFIRPGISSRTGIGKGTASAANKNGVQAAVTTNTQIVTNLVADDFSWGKVESADYKEYIAHLREIGCPELTIQDIILADVNKLYRVKQQDVIGEEDGYKYWKTGNNWNSKAERERQKRSQDLQKEKSELLVALLGVDPEKERRKEMGYEDYWDQRVSFLPEEKRQPVRDIQKKFQEQRQDIYNDGIYDATDNQKLRSIEKAEEAELASILTPQEAEQFQLRNSQIANQLRYDLETLEPSEEEFKTIFRLRNAKADDLIRSNDPDDKETREHYDKAKVELDEQIKSQLGQSRYAEYERAQDYNYKELARLTERLELPKQTAVAVYDLKKIAEGQVKQVREDKSLTTEQRDLALQAIQTETQKAVTTSLGSEKNFNRYKSQGGWWISNLSPKQRVSAAVLARP